MIRLLIPVFGVLAGAILMTPADSRAMPRQALLVPEQYSTIEAAAEAANDGDEIVVGPGTYSISLHMRLKSVTIRSSAGPAQTTLQTGVIDLDTSNTSLAGFTMHGVLVRILNGAPILRGNVIEDTFNGEGPVLVNHSSPLIEGNVFRRHTCWLPYTHAGVVSVINASAAVVRNNVFIDNDCRGIAMQLPPGQSPLVVNNTFVRNSVAIQVDTTWAAGDHVYRNNVLVNNGVGYVRRFLQPEPELPAWDHSLVFGNDIDYAVIDYYGSGPSPVPGGDMTGVQENISVDPAFTDPAGGDLHLQPDSPAIDAGDRWQAPDEDFDGNPRPDDGNLDGDPAVDIGAFEFAICPDVNDDGVIDGADIRHVARARGASEYVASADVNRDGVVDEIDVAVVSSVRGRVCS